MANAYNQRIRGERAENLEAAIGHYAAALEVYTRAAFPSDWAMTQNNLALAYSDRIRGERAENLEVAIGHYEAALEVYTRVAFPEQWAGTQNNLGEAYRNRISGERGANLERAIEYYENALQVYTREAFPEKYRLTQRNLGKLHFAEHHWDAARAAFAAAIAAGNTLFNAAYTDAGRRAEIAETSELYARAAFCHWQLHQPADALAQLEAGKTRLLAQAIALAGADTAGIPPAQASALVAKRDTVRALEAEMRLPPSTPARRSDRELADALRVTRAELDALVAEIRRAHPDFMPLGLSVPEILALVPRDAALVAPLITSEGSIVFVIPAGAQTVDARHVLPLENFTTETLNEMLKGPADDPKWGGWMGAYFAARESRTATAFLDWQSAIEKITGRLWDALAAPIHARLQTLGVQRVILMPMGGLQLLPLHAIWRDENGARRYWLDDFEFTYAPSGYALRAAQTRLPVMSSEARHLAASRLDVTGDVRALIAGVSNSEHGALPYTRVEAQHIAELFGVAPHLDDAATPDAIKRGATGARYVHLSCHGSFAWGAPLDSALRLANGTPPLTLAQILGEMNLRAARLVVLSACETGITDIRQSPDEYVGLPAGFLQAGVAGVVSSLWSVNDLSTALLMIRFYENHLGGQSPAAALRAAQQWLRAATNVELAATFAGYEATAAQAGARMALADAHKHFVDHATARAKVCPFEHPYHWAAFAVHGV